MAVEMSTHLKKKNGREINVKLKNWFKSSRWIQHLKWKTKGSSISLLIKLNITS